MRSHAGAWERVYVSQVLWNSQRRTLPAALLHSTEDIAVPDRFVCIWHRKRLGAAPDMEIDVEAAVGKELWLCESKWLSGRKAGVKEIESLLYKGRLFTVQKGSGLKILRLCFFACGGFTPDAEYLMAKEGGGCGRTGGIWTACCRWRGSSDCRMAERIGTVRPGERCQITICDNVLKKDKRRDDDMKRFNRFLAATAALSAVLGSLAFGQDKICLPDMGEKGKLGLSEVIYILQTVSGFRSDSGAMRIVQSSLDRETAPNVPEEDLKALSAGNRAFALDLYRALRDEQDNLFFSPYSISLALAMAWAGAANETEAQMAQTLHFTLPQDRLHPAFNALSLELASRGEGAEGQDGEPFRLNIANATWGQDGHHFLDSFLDVLAVNYGAGLNLLDFFSDPEASRITINTWVEEQTEDKIKDLVPPGAIDQATRLVLTNAIYFNAAWQYPFEESMTESVPFRLPDGGTVVADMMAQTESFRYAQGDGCQAVELPYDDNRLSMVILLPEDGRFDEFESSFDPDEIIDGMQSAYVHLRMPRFQYEFRVGLADRLAEMGMPSAFSSQADFSGIDGTRDLIVSDVIHKAFVSVDEAGTEAAAATAVLFELTSIPPPPVEMTLDRPFLFFIRDIPTETILFAGRVANPRG